MAGPNRLVASYLSPLDPGSPGAWQSNTGGYAPARGFSFDASLGSANPSLYGGGIQAPTLGRGAGYQVSHPPAMLRLGGQPANQGPFQFSASGLQGPFHFTAEPSVLAPLDSVQEGVTAWAYEPPSTTACAHGPAAAYSSMPPQTPHMVGFGAAMPQLHEARAQTMPEGAQVVDRSTHRASLCEHAFLFVDALQIGRINLSQNKTGLTLVFEQLGDVKMPRDEWYVQVFRNFDSVDCGMIGFNAFKDIVIQWDDHQLEKKRRQREKDQVQAGTSAPTYHPRERPLPQPPPQPVAEARTALMPQPPPQISEPQLVKIPPQTSASSTDSMDAPENTGAVGYAGSTPEAGVPTHGPSKSSHASPGAGRVGAAELNTDVMFPTYVGRLAIFDDYEFYGDAGKGAFGKVMVVKSKNLKQLRACKVMACQTAMQRELIDTEISLLKQLNHPNIVKMFEVYFEEGPEKKVNNGNIYLIFELCEGGDLFGRILHHYEKLHQPMTEGHVAFMMSQILSAIAYLHERGIVHRDIKPENILFVDRSSSSAIKIIDYGLADFAAKIRDTARDVKVQKTGMAGKIARMLPTVNGKHVISTHERKKVMVRAGTPHYMAPEMIEHQWYDQKADIFGIGIILCQLLSGWHPFHIQQVDDEASVKRKIVDPTPVEFPRDAFSNVSSDAQDLCRKLLEKDPQKRFSAQLALEHTWFQDPHKPSPYGDKGGLSTSIFEGLMKYQAYNKLKKAVLQLLTRELSEYQIQELRHKFNALDSKGDGLLSPEELIQGMRHIGYEMKDWELAKVMAALDGTGSNRIGYKEFISALIERRVKFDRAQIEEVFKKFDTENTGRIAYEDVSKILQPNAGGAPGITQSEWVEIVAPGSTSAQRVELTLDQFVALIEAKE